ncbi:MAG: metal-dependent hydrolase [Bdellovibrionales bacterium]|nr:metal-dependent hydrolase [Bdellovibrionales bacterium]
MWVFGHLGIGSKLAAPFSRRLPYGWVLVGTLLPDLIDKPLYYAAAAITGRRGAEIGLISCTRTFGHTALFLFALAYVAFLRKSKVFAALTIGVATHLVLDGFQDYWIIRVLHESVDGVSSLRLAALWPVFSDHFGNFPYASAAEHLRDSFRSITGVGEAVGAAILGWDYWKNGKRFMPPRWLRRRARI